MLTKEQVEFIKEQYDKNLDEYGFRSAAMFGYESALIMILDLIGEEIEGIND